MKNMIVMTAAVVMAVAQSGAPSLCHGDQGIPPVGPSAPFNAELYNLGYDVFLANSNPREAFLLAEKAVAEHPKDINWRRRAAQSGEWSGHAPEALEHWMYLNSVGQEDATGNALRLARATGHNRHLKQLLEQRGPIENRDTLGEYVSACEALGEPERAIDLLERHRGGPYRKEVLGHLARLYEAVGQPQQAVEALMEQMNTFGMTEEGILKAAALTFGTGDIRGAYTILGSGKQSIPTSATAYWQSFGELAWAHQDMPAVELASRKMLESGKPREEDYQRLILLSRDTDPQAAYRLSMDGWHRFRLPDFLRSALELGIAMKDYRAMADMLNQQEREGKLKPQEQDAYFWSLVSQVHRGAGSTDESIRCYREALRRAPADGELAAGYVWLLLDLDRRKELRELLVAWKGRENKMPSLHEPFGAALAYLGEYHKALPYFQARYIHKRNDPAWLASYADTLEQAGWQEAAFIERLNALHLSRTRMKSAPAGNGGDRQALIREYNRVAMLLKPGDGVDNLMREIISGRQDDVSRELVAAWALSSQRTDLARLWFWREYARMTRRPRWVELTLAMENNDRPAMARLLQEDLERLPYRDAIEAAVRTGQTPLAETIAFDRFQVNDRDYLLDNQVRDLFGSRSGGLRYRLSLMDREGVGFLEQLLSVTTAMTPRFSLKLEAGNTDIRHQEQDVIGIYPASIRTARMGATMRHTGGSAEIYAGVRDALYTHPQAGLLGNWRLTSSTTLDMALLSGAESDESVGLKIGGMKDELRLGLQHGLTPRDTLLLRISGSILRDQQWNRLGDGGSIEAELTHRILFTGPDTTLRLFSGYHNFNRGPDPVDRTALLIPAQQRATSGSDYFVPESFALVGVGILVGEEARDYYTRNWRPFGALDVSWNSNSGAGFNYRVGVVGPIVGLDKLEGAFTQESGSFGTSDVNSRFDLNYRYYFR
ncbi:MAG: hypothetical protein ED859_07235 [Desulfuromonadales bacterium]|nr:MAG: hypothetical protein ED859_07235 [Desulfuromonadales bacterium]